MPRPKSLIPRLCVHKSTGRAVVYLSGKPVYLGKAGSPESRKAYAALLDRLTVTGTEPAATTPAEAQPTRWTINDLCLKFSLEKLPTYARAEQVCQRKSMGILCDLFGETYCETFGPLRLRTVRQQMVAKGWSRSFINKQVKRLRHIFRWGVSWELVPPTVAEALRTLESLAAGDTVAPEGRPRRAIPDDHLTAVRAAFTFQRHRDIFDLLLLTGCRSGELLGLTSGMIDRAGEVWRVDLVKHKTAKRGKSRTLFFNAEAQLILRRYLSADPEALLFAVRGDTLAKTFRDACKRAGVPEFTPHCLRHTVATRLADELGIESAQRLLGHAQAAMTEHYSRGAERKAIEAVKTLKIG